MRILDDYGSSNRLRIVNRLLEFFFSDVLDVFVDRQDNVFARLRLLLDALKPLLSRINGNQHVS